MSKPILCLDFDGVCHSYTSGWVNAWTISDPPVPGLFEFLEQALVHFRVAIFSSRSEFKEGRFAMREWFEIAARDYYANKLGGLIPAVADAAHAVTDHLEFPVSKPAAMVTLDDRAVTFTGVWPDVALLKQFQPWTKWNGLNEVKKNG